MIVHGVDWFGLLVSDQVPVPVFSNTPITYERPFRRKDGTIIQVEVTSFVARPTPRPAFAADVRVSLLSSREALRADTARSRWLACYRMDTAGDEVRRRMLATRASDYVVALAYVNLVGGQDELVFDGASCVLAADGRPSARASQFAEELLVVELGGEPGPVAEPLADLDEVYGALVLGLRDYVRKNGFDRVLVAVSGGIDSALVALVAADALGGEQVTGVVMPSPHSSAETQADARAIVRNKAGKKTEFGLAYLISRLGGGYVFGTLTLQRHLINSRVHLDI